MKWKTRLIVVTLLGLMISSGLVASAALGSETSSPQTHAPVGHLDEGLSDILTRMVQEGTITQEQMDAILKRATPLFANKQRAFHILQGRFHPPISLDLAAEGLGLTIEELRIQLGEGKTLAEIAEAQGVTLEELVSSLTAGVEAQLAEAIAAGRLPQVEADERLQRLRGTVTTVVTHAPGPALFGQHRPNIDRVIPHLRGIIRETVGLLGLEPQEIVAQLKGGKTLAQVAEAQGVTLEELVSSLTAGVEVQLAEAIAAGRLIQAEADERLERLRDTVTRAVTHPVHRVLGALQ